MVYNGIRPQQMSAKMNLGDKKQLENLLKEEIDLVNEIYLVNNQEKIEELLMEGKTPDEVIDDLYKRGMGTKEGLTSKFKKYSEKSQDDLIKRSKELLQEAKLFTTPREYFLRKTNNRFFLAKILALKALLISETENLNDAYSTLEESIAFAETGNLIRTYIDIGPKMAKLLKQFMYLLHHIYVNDYILY